MSRTQRAWWQPRLDGLALRVAAYLSLALLPVGLIALQQTHESQRESEQRASLSLLALTGQSAAGVRQAIERALGAAESLGALAGLLADPATCTAYLGRYVEEPYGYAFVGLVPAAGPVTCSSAPAPFEMAEGQGVADLMADPRPLVRAEAGGSFSGRDVIVVLSPLSLGSGAFDGYLSLSIPRERIFPGPGELPGTRPLRLVTFSQNGSILTSQGEDEGDIATLLPTGQDLAGQARGGARSFPGRDAQGRDRFYTVTPLVPDVAYALAVWSPSQGALGVGSASRAPLLFAVLMWGASLLVAFWAVHTLVIRPVAGLGRRMRRFGRDRTLPDPLPAREAAHELREIDEAFRQTAEAILHDEARMENAFRERGVLLREVHHRVKNNLQLISSIISMQVRRAPEPQMRAILRRLQDRVLTLATIYRSLYTSSDIAEVNAAEVLRPIVEQELRGQPAATAVTLDLDDLVLDADKVVPLAFFTAEAVSNAAAHVGHAGGRASLSVSFRNEGEAATLAVANSMPGLLATPLDRPGLGLGHHLIRAFAGQLGAPAAITAEGGTYRIAITFPVDPSPSPAPAPAPAPSARAA